MYTGRDTQHNLWLRARQRATFIKSIINFLCVISVANDNCTYSILEVNYATRSILLRTSTDGVKRSTLKCSVSAGSFMTELPCCRIIILGLPSKTNVCSSCLKKFTRPEVLRAIGRYEFLNWSQLSKGSKTEWSHDASYEL